MSTDERTEKIQIPEGVQIAVDGNSVTGKGPKGEVTRKLSSQRIDVKVEGNEIILTKTSPKLSKKDKMFMNTYRAHMRNLVKGVSEGITYKLKICSGHFPMNVSVKGNILEVKNYLGESVPRKLVLKEGVKVSVDGDVITLDGHTKEVVGTVASDIEQLMRITNRDRRIFQDGIYIIEKDGKEM
jgi:large subunit ribosomal protein L6